jgi:citrate synthase
MNTASTTSDITFLDGEQGHPALPRLPDRAARREVHLRRGRYLLIYGKLPNATELSLHHAAHAPLLIHEDMKRFFDGYPSTAHPMAILSAMVCSLSSYYPDALDVRQQGLHGPHDRAPAREGADDRGVLVQEVASASRSSTRERPVVRANFLNMMFSVPCGAVRVDPTSRAR